MTTPEQQLPHYDHESVLLERDIAHLEQHLCPTTPQRLLLASKFIDYPFFAACLIGGDEHPERYFGAIHWRNYLAANDLATQYTGPLTPDFVTAIHEQFAGNDPRLSNIDSTIGWTVGFSDLSIYAEVTPEAKEAVGANPFVEFLYVTPDVDPREGESSDALKQLGMEEEFFAARLRELGLVIDPAGDQLRAHLTKKTKDVFWLLKIS